MAVYQLTEALAFPPAEYADAEGLLAVGGDLRPERLILAYSQGIFPWPFGDSEDDLTLPMLWFSPDPRYILRPADAHASRSDQKQMRRLMRQNDIRISFDTSFEAIITACSQTKRPTQAGTWITDEIIEAYTRLHTLGFAHSVEVFDATDLIGGLYGVSLGNAFFGESMFSTVSGASKVAIFALIERLHTWGFSFIDCQVHTDHFTRWGAEPISRAQYLKLLHAALSAPTRRGNWT